MEIYAVKINGIENPLGYLYDTLICSWKVRGVSGKKQTNVEIRVALEANMQNVIYELNSPELDSLGVPLKLELTPHTRYYYQIIVTTDANETVQSEVCWFETAKLAEEWSANWIGIEENDSIHPEFLKRFSISKKISQARLYICGLGVFEAQINGKKVGNDVMAPFINDYKEHIQYCTDDVTEHLSEKNEILVQLGKGWYMGHFGLTNVAYGMKTFGLIAEVYIQYEDGSVEVIGTDESWNYRGSVFEKTCIYDGETQNYLLWDGK